MSDCDKAPEKTALFGGTFDPVHLGHIHLARTAVEALGLDQVRFLPCRISPHKLGSRPAPAADRLKMLKLATAELPWAVVDDFETRLEGPSFSYRTAEEMVARFPQTKLFWIMGGDQWAALDQWAEPRRLAACVEFIVFTRGEPLVERDGYEPHPIIAHHPASATAIREALAGGAENHEWLDPQVSRWIREHRLYRDTQ
ncbi:MAG TPA: nicotinate (nicotinamide) nucleotide adenylyltransferase [Luteolibacter sp.]|nr:nicotinate (nicotinamide) nucleotide adenylyltransferase [Luteolibacter sp.]